MFATDQRESESVLRNHSEARAQKGVHVARAGLAGLILGRYSYGYQAARDVCDVLSAAQDIEPDLLAVAMWCQRASITELDGFTAEQLVHAGRVADVLGFLRSIKRLEGGLR
jgi:hypothetical protein